MTNKRFRRLILLWGTTLFLGFLAIFSYISLRISLKCRNNYTKLVSIGCGVLLIGQSIMHIAVATGSMPTTGLPLPFISYGGTSLVVSMSLTGLLLNISASLRPLEASPDKT